MAVDPSVAELIRYVGVGLLDDGGREKHGDDDIFAFEHETCSENQERSHMPCRTDQLQFYAERRNRELTPSRNCQQEEMGYLPWGRGHPRVSEQVEQGGQRLRSC